MTQANRRYGFFSMVDALITSPNAIAMFAGGLTVGISSAVAAQYLNMGPILSIVDQMESIEETAGDSDSIRHGVSEMALLLTIGMLSGAAGYLVGTMGEGLNASYERMSTQAASGQSTENISDTDPDTRLIHRGCRSTS